MKMTLGKLASFIKAELVGNPDIEVSGVSPIENGKKGTISFLGNPKYEAEIYHTKASAVIVQKTFQPNAKQRIDTNLLKVENVYETLAYLMQTFSYTSTQEKGVSEQAYIDSSAQIAKNVYIGHFAVISANAQIGKNTSIHPQVFIGEEVKIGENCKIFPGVKIMHQCVIGNNCIIYPNAVIGSDGFGYAPTEDGSYKAIPQIGNVVLEDNVEVGANTNIDRATMGSTMIREGVKLDNLIQVGHNVEIDKHTVMAALSGISGSAKIGKYCRIGGQVGFAGHIKVADKTQIMAQSGVMSNVDKEESILCGSPTIDYKQYFRSFAIYKKLPALEKRVRELEKIIEKK
jgi:UDP-3-O-[3-hydroxymyristoyl] glucosamine N-acyltransferase